MRKAVAFALLALLMFGFAAVSLADEVSLKPTRDGQWAILDSGGKQIGLLAKVEDGAYSILPKGGHYLGIVRSNGDLQLTGRHPAITPSDARLYLDVLDALKTLK